MKYKRSKKDIFFCPDCGLALSNYDFSDWYSELLWNEKGLEYLRDHHALTWYCYNCNSHGTRWYYGNNCIEVNSSIERGDFVL